MRREELYLADLVDNARAVRGYLDGVIRERWDADGMLRDAVLYRMLLLGEIASALPDDLRDRYPDVAWRQIRAFRNLAVHKYFGIDWAVVWKIAQEEPPVLERQVLAIITAEYPELAQAYEPGTAPDAGTGCLRNHPAVTTGQGRSGPAIAAAAGIMILVFGSLVFGARAPAEFGFGLGFSVLVDALLIRSLLVPALMHLIGPANWALPGAQSAGPGRTAPSLWLSGRQPHE